MSVGSAAATPGLLDPGFGSGGSVTTGVGSGGSDAYALALQPDGKIVAGGEARLGSQSEFALARYEPNGSLDPSFGTGGEVTTAIGSTSTTIRALVMQSDGKIVAGGRSYDSQSGQFEFVLARYDANGSLDTSFGTNGTVVTPTSGGGEIYALARQPDGKIVAGGSSEDNLHFVIARYDADGSLDTSFGTGGVVTTEIGHLEALALQPDGKIVAAGGNSAWNDFALARYNPDGSLDTSFGSGGTLGDGNGTTSPQGVAYGLVVQPDGKIVAAGDGQDISAHGVVARFDSNGNLDAGFSQEATGEFGPGSSLRAIALQPDGKLVLAGSDYEGPTQGFLVARLNADGSADNSFVNGTTAIGANNSLADAVLLQPDGKIVAGGYTTSGTNDLSGDEFALARFVIDSTLTVSKSGNGVGSVSSSPAGIDCGQTCSASFSPTVTVTLTASPAAGSTFKGWSGACSGTGTCTVSTATDESVQADFAKLVIVPKLTRKTLSAAKRLLRATGCSLGKVTRAYSGTIPRGHVIGQKPRAGTRRLAHAKVSLVMSKGRPRSR